MHSSTPASEKADPTPLLEVRDLTVSFRTQGGLVRAVGGVSFTINANEIVSVVGESGCGKTVTLLSVVAKQPQHHSDALPALGTAAAGCINVTGPLAAA